VASRRRVSSWIDAIIPPSGIGAERMLLFEVGCLQSAHRIRDFGWSRMRSMQGPQNWWPQLSRQGAVMESRQIRHVVASSSFSTKGLSFSMPRKTSIGEIAPVGSRSRAAPAGRTQSDMTRTQSPQQERRRNRFRKELPSFCVRMENGGHRIIRILNRLARDLRIQELAGNDELETLGAAQKEKR
jgi:hypothetical protein